MIKLFNKISDKEKNKLINYLEGLYYTQNTKRSYNWYNN